MNAGLMPERLNLPEGKEWFTLKEVADAVGRHKLTVYGWERRGLIDKPQRVPLGLGSKVMMRRYSRAQVLEIWAKMTKAA